MLKQMTLADAEYADKRKQTANRRWKMRYTKRQSCASFPV
ncbi:hypothetical protein ALP73_200104 [Pseudomonas coronafaciens pv. garcae]|nr:hypothetical protein ALP73_200104 [Pseudomonas coronafaciens pv. garcae]